MLNDRNILIIIDCLMDLCAFRRNAVDTEAGLQIHIHRFTANRKRKHISVSYG